MKSGQLVWTFGASSAWHELCVLTRRLAGRCIHWAITIH